MLDSKWLHYCVFLFFSSFVSAVGAKTSITQAAGWKSTGTQNKAQDEIQWPKPMKKSYTQRMVRRPLAASMVIIA